MDYNDEISKHLELLSKFNKNIVQIDGISDEDYDYLYSDDALFHYTKSSIVIEFILKEMKLRLNTFRNFKDPKEKLLHHPMSSFWGEGNIHNISNQIHEKYLELIEQVRIICFCTNNQKIEYVKINEIGRMIYEKLPGIETFYLPHPGFDKDRMWEIYGDNSSGICLILSKNEILKQFEKKGFEYKADLINYHRKLFPSIGGYNCNNEIDEEAKKMRESKLFKKSFDYRDENEFRIIVNYDKPDVFFIDINSSFKGVILGTNFKEIYYPLIFNPINEIYGKENNKMILKAYLESGGPYYWFQNIKEELNETSKI